MPRAASGTPSTSSGHDASTPPCWWPRHSRLADRVREADLVVTGEGTYDWRSLQDSVPAAVSEIAMAAGVPAIVLAGQTSVGRREAMTAGFSATYAVADRLAAVAGAARRPGRHPGGARRPRGRHVVPGLPTSGRQRLDWDASGEQIPDDRGCVVQSSSPDLRLLARTQHWHGGLHMSVQDQTHTHEHATTSTATDTATDVSTETHGVRAHRRRRRQGQEPAGAGGP